MLESAARAGLPPAARLMSDPTAPVVTPLPVAQPPVAKPRLKKRRLLLVLIPLSLLALVSTVFGMMMAVASDLPSLEQLPQTAGRQNSVLFDAHGRKLGTLTSNEGRIIVGPNDVAPYVKYAVIAIEDKRFYENPGIDVRGVARAFVNDVIARKPVQGGSTIAQQFVKVALKAQTERTLFNKLREAALAYHLTRKWSKEKILTEYLNSVYFGNGAYGVEAAARTYFAKNHVGCGSRDRPCARELFPHEAALLAGIIASPSRYDPLAHPVASQRRRDLVLRKMVEQGRLTESELRDAIVQALPAQTDISPPQLESKEPYFTSWVRQVLVDEVGPQQAFEGGLRVITTLDLDLQDAARQAVTRHLAWAGGPTAALVAIDNETGAVRAMIGGRDYETMPFNLATQGQRQPGSAIKPFILAAALRDGLGPGSVWPSQKREFIVPGTRGREKFVVNNFEDRYSGRATLANALTASDNSVFAAVGIKVGTRKIAKLAEEMGIRTPVSSNLAMTLGGLKEGVTPLDMAHAYETFAAGGNRITGTLGAGEEGPVGIRQIERFKGGKLLRRNKVVRRRVLSPKLAELAKQMLQGPVKFGTAKRAAYGGFAAGKTGTTENFGDAWFVGFTDRFTIAVWVGYPDRLKPMKTEFAGQEVTGGTFPALIWHDFVVGANRIVEARQAAARAKRGLPPKPTTTPQESLPQGAAPESPDDTGGTEAPKPSRRSPARKPSAPAPDPAPTPEETGGVDAGGVEPPPE